MGSVPGTPTTVSKEDLKKEDGEKPRDKGGEEKRKSWSLSGMLKKATV